MLSPQVDRTVGETLPACRALRQAGAKAVSDPCSRSANPRLKSWVFEQEPVTGNRFNGFEDSPWANGQLEIRFSRDIATRISYHGEKTYPEECCGVIFGLESDGVRTVTEVEELPNTHCLNRETRYLVTPAEYLRMERHAFEKNNLILGFYHSHPDHPAEPSQFDLENALPWFSYVIQAIEGRHAGRMAAWALSEDRVRFNQQPLSLEGIMRAHK